MRKVMSLLLSGAAAMLVAACSSEPEESEPAVPLYDNLGDYHHEITTASDRAQQYFDQGLRLSYAFNHAEAIRSFQQAAELDPGCAMCYWGVAFALGPNINAPITEDAAKEAWEAIGQARTRASNASDRERAYIDALARRYTVDPKAARPALDGAYAEAMRDVMRRFPDDLDAATLFAQSLMDTSPWNYWDLQGNPRPFTNEVVGTLESVLARQADHAGAIHLYIHAVEASPNPARAAQYADKLPALVPGAGHLVHMPAHIYLRVGRFSEASKANEDAIKVDTAYLAGDAAPNNMTYQIGYYPHNMHLLVTAASMEGRRAEALKAAEDVRARMHGDMLQDPGMGGMVQHMNMTPLLTKVRFGLWDQVLAEPAPADGLPYMQAIWHATRGLAYGAQGNLREAQVEQAAVVALKDDESLKTLGISSVNFASAIVAIASDVLAGDLAMRQRRGAEAARHFASAVAREDSLIYMEPPDWPIPVRQLQGAAMLELGRLREAEAAFRDDMKKFPENGWSLSGLLASLQRQGRQGEAATVQTRLDQAWRNADTVVSAAQPRGAR